MQKGEKFDKITPVKGMQIPHIGDSPSGKATDSDSVIRVFESLRPSQQKTHFCLPTKVRFLNDVCLRQMMTATPNDVRFANDVCLRQMMTATPNDVRFANDVCLTAHWGKHRIIAERSGATSF